MFYFPTATYYKGIYGNAFPPSPPLPSPPSPEQLEGLGSAVSSPSGVWDGAPASSR